MGTRKKSQPSYSPSRVVPRGCPTVPLIPKGRRRLCGSGLTLINPSEYVCDGIAWTLRPVMSRMRLHHDETGHAIDSRRVQYVPIAP